MGWLAVTATYMNVPYASTLRNLQCISITSMRVQPNAHTHRCVIHVNATICDNTRLHKLCVFPPCMTTTGSDSETPSRRVELRELRKHLDVMRRVEVAPVCFPPSEQLCEYFHFVSMSGDDGGGHFLSRFISPRNVNSVCLPRRHAACC